jgi:integrase
VNPADQPQQTAPALAGAEATEAPASARSTPAPRSLSIAAHSIAARLRALSERPQAISVREVIDRYMAAYTGTDTTIVQRLTTWQIILGDFTLEKLDADVIHAARQEIAALPALAYKGRDHEGNRIFKTKGRERKKSPATINRYHAAISGAFTWAIEQRLAPRGWVNPCRGIKRMPEPNGRVRFLDNAERARLFDACRASRYPQLYALVLTAILTGARRGELLSLRWADVDLERGLAQLGRTKNGDRRTLVLLPQVISALRPFASDVAARFVFGSRRSKQQTPAVIDNAWRAALARSNVDNFRFHDLRHCCASYLAQHGTPLNVIAEILGHRKLDMSKRYAHLTTQTKAAAMRAALGSVGAEVAP